MKIGFSTDKKNFISKAIIYFTKEKAHFRPYISHAFPVLGELEGMELALSSDEILNNIVDINRYRDKKNVLRIYYLQDIAGCEGWQKKIVTKWNQKVYPHLELLWFIYRFIRRRFNPEWNGKNPIKYSVFCSELTIEALRLAGYNFPGDANSTDAIELENWVMQRASLVEFWE